MNVRVDCPVCGCWAVIPLERTEGWREDHQLGHPHVEEKEQGSMFDDELHFQADHLDAIAETP